MGGRKRETECMKAYVGFAMVMLRPGVHLEGDAYNM